jgi:glyoxylase I family protein
VRCQSADGGHGGEHLGPAHQRDAQPGNASAHFGLEHFGFDSVDIDADIRRLEGLGAKLLEGPIVMPNGGRIAFMRAPDDTRVELIQPGKVSGACC